MDKVTPYTPLVARLLISALFLFAAYGKISDVPGLVGNLAYVGLPAVLAWPTIIVEFAIGIAMIVGYQTRIMALVGAAFCVVTGVLYHLQPSDPMQTVNFLKNLGLAGGFLMLFSNGAGAVALDKR